jgi:uncharacterized protein (UPF0261 family)
MVVTLPVEIQQQLTLRQAQLAQLSLFYGTNIQPKVLVAYGSDDTAGQLETLGQVLNSRNIQNVLIDCRECLSQRHLLSKIFSRCVQVLEKEDEIDGLDRLDSINALASSLKRLLHSRQEKLLIVVNGADHQRGATVTLLPALARLPDLVWLSSSTSATHNH